MKRFLSAVVFCVCLLIFGLIVLLPQVSAEKNLLPKLLNLPAPAPSGAANGNPRPNYASMAESDDPPDDNAPIEELLEFWRRQNNAFREMGYNLQPSATALQRILSNLRENPDKLPNYLNILPEDADTQDFVKSVYDRQNAGGKDEDEEDGEKDERLKTWLTYHSRFFSDELVKSVAQVADTNEYVNNQKELLALARVDWEKARPMIERLLSDDNQPISQTLARWAFYQHALREGNSSDAATYRRKLQETVENKTAKPGNRDLAMDALVESGDFEGRDDWYYTLLDDETLYDLRVNGMSYTGLTTLLNRSPRGKYLAKMLELINNSNPTIRKAAVRNLTVMIDPKNPEVVRALLPWLENPDWAQEVENERRRLVAALAQTAMPESVPGLIRVLNEKQNVRTPSSGSSMMAGNSNVMMSGSAATKTNRADLPSDVPQFEYALRSEAVSALAFQKDARAIAPLRELLPQVESWQTGNIVRALLASGGFTIPEQVEALETVAAAYQKTNEPENEAEFRRIESESATIDMRRDEILTANTANVGKVYVDPAYVNRRYNPADIKPILGQQIAGQFDPPDELVAALVERIKVLDVKEPPTASGLRKIMLNWRGAAINRMLLRDVRDDKAEVDTIVKLLSLRKSLRENQSDDISDLRNGSQTAFGISLCLLENPTEYDALLESGTVEAKTAMLACARLIRAALPVAKVAENLSNPNATLALAAERYLETEDSPAAQNFVLARHPNEAKILGAKKAFTPDDAPPTRSSFLSLLFATVENGSGGQSYYYDESEDALAAGEKKLQKEVKETPELLGVYAYDDNFVRVYRDRAVFSWQTDQARFRERELAKDEFESFKSYIAAERVNELPPSFSVCDEGCAEKELLMLGRGGGRRIYTMGSEPPRFFGDLARMFEQMRQTPAKLRYALEKNVKGLEILFEDENLNAETVWKNGADLRVLVSDAARRVQIDKELRKQERAEEQKEDVDYEQLWKVRQKRRAGREYENFAWHTVSGGKLGELSGQPPNVEFIVAADGAAVRPEKAQWKARTGAFEIRADADGLYKIAGGRSVKIADGYYENPVVTPDGRWAVATKFGGEGGAGLMRVNLTTRREFPVKFDGDYYPRFIPVAFIASLNKVLVFKGIYSEGEDEVEEDVGAIINQPNGEFYVIDPETGVFQKAKGEVRPLAQQTFRPLQTTGKPDEYWAAIPDAGRQQTEVGVYNGKTLTFKPLLKLPEIEFNSMQMWIDADRIYFVYHGQLLDLPLPKTAPANG